MTVPALVELIQKVKRRVKQGTPSTHPIVGDELRALRRLQREQEPQSPFVFTSERGAPFTTAGFARMIEVRLQAASSHAQTCLRLCAGSGAFIISGLFPESRLSGKREIGGLRRCLPSAGLLLCRVVAASQLVWMWKSRSPEKTQAFPGSETTDTG